MQWLGDLWHGRLPLREALVRHALVIGGIANLAASGAALGALAAGLPGGLAVALHLAPLPYNVAALTGVWRSAERLAAEPDMAAWARTAQAIAFAWFAVLLVI